MKKIIIFMIMALAIFTGCGSSGGEGSKTVTRAVSGVSPSDSATGITVSPLNIKWTSEGMNSPIYSLYLGETKDSMAVAGENISGTEYTITTTLKNSTTYYWKVAATDVDGTVESSVMQFTTVSKDEVVSVIPKAVPSYPAQDAADISTTADIIIKWNYSLAVTGYTFDIYTGESADKLALFSSVTGKKQLTVTKLTLESNKKYYWKVITKDTNGNSSESDIYSFTTKKLSTDYSVVATMVKAKDTKATSIEEQTYDKNLSKIYDSSYNTIGYYLTTTPYGDDIKGYAGSCPVLVTTDIEKKITSIQLMTGLSIYKETPSYVQRVIDAGFFNKWNGTDITTAGELKVDTVAGSTLTSRAVINNIKRRVGLLSK